MPKPWMWCLLVAFWGCQGGGIDMAAEMGTRTCGLDAVADRIELPDTSLAGESGGRALLASRLASMEALREVADVDYLAADGHVVKAGDEVMAVRVVHCSHGLQVTSILAKGFSQDDISKAQQAGLLGAAGLAWNLPFAVAQREDLRRVLSLARRKPALFGEGDPAFFDLAEAMVKHLDPRDKPYLVARDTSEKGYLNTFNHVTAQAFIATLFSEELADFVADVHERKNMPELITGKFTEQQLADPDNNPMDNYVDMVNNEWGQALGLVLRGRHGIQRGTHWTPELMAAYLNDVQAYYAWAFRIGLRPFRVEDELVNRFAAKVNAVMGGMTISNG